MLGLKSHEELEAEVAREKAIQLAHETETIPDIPDELLSQVKEIPNWDVLHSKTNGKFKNPSQNKPPERPVTAKKTRIYFRIVKRC